MISALLVSALLGAAPGPDVGELIKEVRRGFIEDGLDLVSATATHRVIAHPDGSLELQGEQPLRLSLQSITRATSCQTNLRSRVAQFGAPNSVRSLRGCDVEESWTNTSIGLEHAFTILRAPPGSGGFSLFVRVEGPWHHQDGDGHVFKGPGALASLRYGSAFVVKGSQRTQIEVAHVEGGLELRIPAALADAPGAFPMEIDPVLSGEVGFELGPAGPSAGREEAPAIAVSSSGIALVVWVDTRRQLGFDIFGARIGSGTVADPVGIPISVSPGPQVNPAVCADGANFLVAWQTPIDGGFQIRARQVGVGGVPGTEFPVVFGSQPALATAGDAGINLMAYVDPSTNVQVVPIVGTSVGGPAVIRAVAIDERAANPAIAASNRGWFAAYETTPVGSSLTSIRGLANGSGAAIPVYDNMTAVVPRRPTVALGAVNAAVDDAFIFWNEESPPITRGARVSTLFPTANYNFPGSSAALARTSQAIGVWPVLGSFIDGGLQLRDLSDGGTAMYPAGPQPNGLVLAAAGTRVVGAWTESPRTESDIYGGVLGGSGTASSRFLVSGSGDSQRVPRVAFVDDMSEGLAVWIDGTNTIFGARVIEDVNGLRVSGKFVVHNSPLQTIEAVEVAAVASNGGGGNASYLVTWRHTLLPGIKGQLSSSTSTSGNPFDIVVSGVNAGPAVAWDEGNQVFQVAWNQGTEIITRSVTTDGVLGTPTTRLTGGLANQLDLSCLRSNCLVAWEKTSGDVSGVMFGNVAGAPLVRNGAKSPALAHDGTNFWMAWRTTGGISFATVDSTTGAITNTQSNIVSQPTASVVSMKLASATPPVLVWSEVSNTDELNIYLQRADVSTPAQFIAAGLDPALGIGQVSDSPHGVVVYQRYLASNVNAQRVFGRAFTYVPDAGYIDAGFDAGVDAGVDAGTPDAGTDGGAGGEDAGEDAGVDAGPMMPSDAGVDAGVAGPFQFDTTGCGCQSSSGVPLLVFAVMLLRRRRAHPSLSRS